MYETYSSSTSAQHNFQFKVLVTFCYWLEALATKTNVHIVIDLFAGRGGHTIDLLDQAVPLVKVNCTNHISKFDVLRHYEYTKGVLHGVLGGYGVLARDALSSVLRTRGVLGTLFGVLRTPCLQDAACPEDTGEGVPS